MGMYFLDASSYNSVKIKQEDIVDEVGKAGNLPLNIPAVKIRITP